MTRGGVRLGIVGTGVMAGQMAQAANAVAGVSVSAVLSRDTGRASAFSDTFAAAAVACDDIGRFFELVDAVYVATPPAAHGGVIEKAIDAGKPVLCEKPLTMSAAETARLLGHARAADVLLMEAIWTLALPAYRALKETLGSRSNALLQFDFSYPADLPLTSHVLQPDTGGVLIDRSVYGYAAAISLFGDVTGQSVWVTRNDAGLDTDAELRLEHAEGARSIISLSLNRIGPNLLSVSNDAELLVLGPTSLAAETIRRHPRPAIGGAQGAGPKSGLKARLKAAPALRAIKARLPAKSQFFSYGASSYAPILQEFVSAVEQGRTESEIVPHRLSTEIAALTETARQPRK